MNVKYYTVIKPIYLDYNATVPILKEVKKSLIECIDEGPMNASSIHYYGRKGKDIIYAAKTNISNLIDTNENNIIFTSSSTEAINLLFSNFETIVVSSIEHLAVLSSCRGDHIIPVNQDGVMDLNFLELYLKKLSKINKKILVSVMWVNNETGVVQPIKDVVMIAKKYGCLVHCDGAQALGKIKINLEEIELDFNTLWSQNWCSNWDRSFDLQRWAKFKTTNFRWRSRKRYEGGDRKYSWNSRFWRSC